MKKGAPRIRETTLQRLWDDAESSALNEQPEVYIEVIGNPAEATDGGLLEESRSEVKPL